MPASRAKPRARTPKAAKTARKSSPKTYTDPTSATA